MTTKNNNKQEERKDDTKLEVEKRIFMAKKELLNRTEAAVDVIINLNNIVEVTADRWSLNYSWLMNWLIDAGLPFKRSLDEDDTDDEV